MPTRIDHLIIAAPDVVLLEEAFRQLGFHIVGGGTHPHLGTRNRIIVLGEGYIELLAVADVARASEALLGRIRAGAGWVGYAMQSADIEAETEAMRARGVDARGPVPGRLVATDGRERSWRVTTIGSDDLWAAALPLPFLIQHNSMGAQHQRELAGRDPLEAHANGSTRLAGVRLRLADYPAALSNYERAFTLPHAAPDEPRTSQRNGSERAVTFITPLDGQTITLEQPANPVAEVALRANTDTIMTARVATTDVESAQRLAFHAGCAATPIAGGVSVKIPRVQAEIEFVAEES